MPVNYRDICTSLRSLEKELQAAARRPLKRCRLAKLAADLESFPWGADAELQSRFLQDIGDGDRDLGIIRHLAVRSEAMEFKHAYEAATIDQRMDRQELGRWKKAVEGPQFPDQESGGGTSNYPRNTLFELRCLSDFRNRGLKPQVVEHGDILVEAGSAKVRVECKRVFDENTVAKNLNEAMSSLERADVQTATASGLILPATRVICISLDRAFQKSSPRIMPSSEDLARYVRAVVAHEKEHLERLLAYPLLACVAFIARAVVGSKGELIVLDNYNIQTAREPGSQQMIAAEALFPGQTVHVLKTSA